MSAALHGRGCADMQGNLAEEKTIGTTMLLASPGNCTAPQGPSRSPRPTGDLLAGAFSPAAAARPARAVVVELSAECIHGHRNIEAILGLAAQGHQETLLKSPDTISGCPSVQPDECLFVQICESVQG